MCSALICREIFDEHFEFVIRSKSRCVWIEVDDAPNLLPVLRNRRFARNDTILDAH